MPLTLGKLRIGKVDGKHEFLTPVEERDALAFDAFLIPESVDPSRMHNGDIFYIEGFRGTGKTSLLRWHAQDRRRTNCLTEFILFKSDLNETQRMHISNEVGISWIDLDATKMEISQDFKSAWTWFVLHKIGESLQRNPRSYKSDDYPSINRVIKLLGQNENSPLQKAIGFMPRLDGAHVKIRGDAGFFSAELGADFKPNGDKGEVTLDALIVELFICYHR